MAPFLWANNPDLKPTYTYCTGLTNNHGIYMNIDHWHTNNRKWEKIGDGIKQPNLASDSLKYSGELNNLCSIFSTCKLYIAISTWTLPQQNPKLISLYILITFYCLLPISSVLDPYPPESAIFSAEDPNPQKFGGSRIQIQGIKSLILKFP